MINNKKYENVSRDYSKNTFRVQWHITERCNLHCLHCYQDELCVKNEMSFSQIKKATDMLKKTVNKWGMNCEISITGGEPLVRKDWFKICKYFDTLGFDISILSNGILLNEQTALLLKKLPKLRYVQISLDGGSKEYHEKVRGKGNFEKALRAINILKDKGIKVATKFTVHKINLSDLKNYLDLTERIGIDFVSVARYVPWGHGENIKNFILSPLEIKKVFELVLSYARKNKGKVRYDARRPLFILLKDKINDVGGRCVAGSRGLTILPNGDVLPCRPMGVKIGNVLKQTFFEIWYTNQLLWKIRNFKNWECGGCKYNKFCGGCLALSNAIHKDYFVKDPQCFKGEL